MMAIYKRLSIVLGAGLVVMALGGCKQEGPAERAGKEIDGAAERLGEALEKQGPVERAGEQIDEAMEKASDKLNRTTRDWHSP